MDGGSAVSTFLTDSLELELGTEWCKPPCFSCAFDNREGRGFPGESYLAAGSLKRQQLFNLESLAQVSCDFGKIATLHAKADSIRQQCVTFLHYIKVFIFRCLKIQDAENHNLTLHPYEALEAQLPSVLVDELRGLLLYIGHLAELPSVTLGAFVNQNQIKAKDPLGFSWWISVHVASLYQIDRHGVSDEMRQMKSNWGFIEELLKQSITVQDSILEEQLRMYLHCCLTLCDFWEPNTSIVTILWEYYSKNLNSSFSISWLPLKGLTNIIKSPLSLLTMVRTCCCDKQDPDLYKSSSSYTIFLCILAKVVKKAMKNNGPHPWKQVKGRALVWKGQMAFLLMYAQKNLDIGVWAEKLSCEFQEKAKEFLVSKNDEMVQRHTLWTLLSIYIDGVQEVFETSCCLYPSHEHLLNDGFSMLLRACRESELLTVLNFLQAVLARIRYVSNEV
ncbi:hypothetical protein ACRRTK_021219 [Alexandromys fortis]